VGREFIDMVVGHGPFLVDGVDGSLHTMHAIADLEDGEWIEDYLEQVRRLEHGDPLRSRVAELIDSGHRLDALRLVRASAPDLGVQGAKYYVEAAAAGVPVPERVRSHVPRPPVRRRGVVAFARSEPRDMTAGSCLADWAWPASSNSSAALEDPRGVIVHHAGALERVHLLLAGWAEGQCRLTDTEARMLTVLDELQLTDLVTSIVGLSAIGAAAILAETGDLTRFASARAVVKHAGLAPREKTSGTFTGRTELTGQGRPSLRLAAWRAVWGAQRANSVYAARYRRLTSRAENKLTPTQAQAAIAASILRQLHAVITTGCRWDPRTATHGTRTTTSSAIAARARRSPEQAVGASLTRHWDTP
jgi:hypothetical protein